MLRDSDKSYDKLIVLAMEEFSDIVAGYKMISKKLRFLLVDNSYIDVWFSKKRPYFSYHWERTMVDGTIYRHNNFPDPQARKLKTYPKHFHEGDENVIKESYISDEVEEAVRQFLRFAREKINK